MTNRILIPLLLSAGASGALLFSGLLTSQAVQNPTISLDMVTTGNTYDETMNTMTVGTIDNCLTTAPPGSAVSHLHQTHLIIQNVEDLVGWQVRFNYIGDKMRVNTINFTPFTDNNTGQNVSFTNLPIDQLNGLHRTVTSAGGVGPAAPADGSITAQTHLAGATYDGIQNFAVSADSPHKTVPDNSSYDAPNGGILAVVSLQVVGNEQGQPSLLMNLDDDSPNPPGSRTVVFNGTGTADINLTPGALGDAFHGEGASCVPLDCVNYECPGPATPSPTPTIDPVPTIGPTPTVTPMPKTIRVPADQSTVQAGIDAASNGDTVLVAPGTYFERVDFKGKAITVTSQVGPSVTVIDGQGLGTVVAMRSGETRASVLNGFTIRNGIGGFNEGGGLSILSSPTIRGNVISANKSCSRGSGVAVLSGSPLIRSNEITYNSNAGCPGTDGAGLSIGGQANAEIVENIISYNTVTGSGGGIALNAAGSPLIRDNLIFRNKAAGTSDSEGGGIWIVNHSDAVIAQNLIAQNQAPEGAGVYFLVVQGSRGPFLINNTIVDNEGQIGAGVYADGFDSEALLVNNILAESDGDNALHCSELRDPRFPILRFNDVHSSGGTAYSGACADQTGLTGNISADPLLANPAADNYHLVTDSPAIDAGDNTAPELPATDFDGEPRIQDGNGDGNAIVDMGAYEFTPSTPTPTPTPDSGLHDGRAKKIGAATTVTLTDGTPDAKEIHLQVRNDGDHTESFGVYVDVVPPGGNDNPYACTPAGRVIDTVVTLAPEEQTVVKAFPTFSCADVAGAQGQSYAISAAVDAHGDDAGACAPSQIQSMACYNALADDDADDADNRTAANAFRVR